MFALIVEDDPVVALILEMIVQDTTGVKAVVTGMVSEALKMRPDEIEFAFLDVDVTNGKTFDVAARLTRANVPFTFVSASDHHDVPVELSDNRFIAKPFRDQDVEEAIRLMCAR